MATNVDDLLKLPVAERIRIAEILWSSIPANADVETVPLTVEQRCEIDMALQECETDPERAVPYEEIIAELRSRQQPVP